MNEQPIPGKDYAIPGSRLSRHVEHLANQIKRLEAQVHYLKQDVASLEAESDYWRRECDIMDDKLRRLAKENGQQ